jgi:hypothetical protein
MGRRETCPHCQAPSDYWNLGAPRVSDEAALDEDRPDEDRPDEDRSHEDRPDEDRDAPSRLDTELEPPAAEAAGDLTGSEEAPTGGLELRSTRFASWIEVFGDEIFEEIGQSEPPSGPEGHDAPGHEGTETLALEASGGAGDDRRTLEVSEGAAPGWVAVAELVRLSPPGLGALYTLAEGENQIGTRGEHDVVLADRTISNPHAVIFCRREGGALVFRLTDLKSKNGTYVDGERVERVELHDGAMLRLADVEFRFRTLG